jgi:hypothetical protein
MSAYQGPERRHMERRGWRNGWLGKFTGRLWFLIAYTNTMQTRFLLCIAATAWVVGLSLPGDSFSRPTFRYMAALASEHTWLVGFGGYAVATFVRIFSDWNGRLAAFAINGFGATLFSAVAFAVATVPGETVPPGAASHLAIAAAAVWVLIRTHVNSAGGWQHD